MIEIITALMGDAGKAVAALALALIAGFAAYLRGRADGNAKAEARADRAALDTIRRIEDAKDSAAAGGGDWHERLRRTGK